MPPPSSTTTTSLFFTLGLSLQLTVLCWRIEGSVCSWPPPSPTDAGADGEIIGPSPDITERLKLFRSTPNAQAGGNAIQTLGGERCKIDKSRLMGSTSHHLRTLSRQMIQSGTYHKSLNCTQDAHWRRPLAVGGRSLAAAAVTLVSLVQPRVVRGVVLPEQVRVQHQPVQPAAGGVRRPLRKRLPHRHDAQGRRGAQDHAGLSPLAGCGLRDAFRLRHAEETPEGRARQGTSDSLSLHFSILSTTATKWPSLYLDCNLFFFKIVD